MKRMFWLNFLDRDVYLQIVLLDCTQLEYKCKASANGLDVLHFVLDYLNIAERKYFGLRYLDAEDQVHWLDTKKPLKKQLKKCTEPYVFYFCIKFYTADPCDIQDDNAKLEFFLQVWEEISRERLPVPFDELAELGARVLQYEIGDFNPVKHKPGYSAALTFAPEKNVRLEQKIESIHRTLRGLSREETINDFLDRARRLDLYGVELHPVVGEDESRYFLGLSPGGIMLVHNDMKVGIYQWDNVVRITKDLDFRWRHSRSSRVTKGGTVLISVRNLDDNLNVFGFRLATREACRHLWKTTNDYIRFYHETEDTGIRSPSLSRIFRRSEKHRSSSRAESEMMSLTSDRRSIPPQPKVTRPTSIRRHVRPLKQPTVIYEDEECTVIKDENGNICQQLKLPPAVNPSRDLINLRLPSVASHYERTGGGGVSARRSHSPMSIQSSFSTNPRRLPETKPVDTGNDSDSVFSNSSRAISDAETLKRKRKRSVMTENASSGASEENDRSQTVPRGGDMRNSLGPQRRRGKSQMRFKTMDGSSIKAVLSQMNTQPLPAFTPVPILQPAKSLNYLNSNTLNPPITPSAKVLKEFNFKVDSANRAENVFDFPHKPASFGFKFEAPSISPMMIMPSLLSNSSRNLKPLEVPKLCTVPVPLAEADQTPRHNRSLSTSDTTSPAAQPSRRSRIRSDSQFADSGERMSSPFSSPFPIIPPPTPFTEPECSQAPAVPPRPVNALNPLASKLFGKRSDRVLGSRSDSFNVAVTGSDMEMQSMRPVDEKLKPMENVYDVVYGETTTAKQVVAVDVHRHSPPSKTDSEKGIYDRLPLRESTRIVSSHVAFNPAMGVLAASNEMYFELSQLANDDQKENTLPKSPRAKLLSKSVPVTDTQGLGLSSNSVIMTHPLAIYSTDGTSSQPIGNIAGSRCAPVYESRASSSLLQSVYAHCSDYAASTDI